MKKDSYFQLDQINSEQLKSKQKLYANPLQVQSQSCTTSSKKSITQNINFQPMPLQQKSFFMYSKNQEYNGPQINRPMPSSQGQCIDNPERIKSSSFHDKNGKQNSKFQYLAFVQRQYKEEKQKKVNLSSIEMQNKWKQEMQQIKGKLEKYYEELQKQDEMIVRKQKQLFDSNRQLQMARQKISKLQNQCEQMQSSFHALYEQCLHYQSNEEYNNKLADNYRILSQKCSQLEQILQQKDQYIQTIIKSKNDQYDHAINTKNHEIKALEERLRIIQKQNQQLIYKIKAQDAEQRLIKQTPQLDASKFSVVGQQFEQKINFYVNENTKLKNVISRYEGEVEQLRIQKESLENTLQAYEDRDKVQKVSKLQSEVILLRDALENEKLQKDELISRHDLEMIKLENIMSSRKMEEEGTLINLYDRQRLRQNLYLALEEVEKLNQKLNEIKEQSKTK